VELSNPVVRRFVAAVNAGDRLAFFDLLTPSATMSDDGSERDLAQWAEREIFSSNGRMEVASESDDGLSLIANYSNSTWGAMRTRWRFKLSGERIARFETGQARPDDPSGNPMETGRPRAGRGSILSGRVAAEWRRSRR
jgi:hypothetical protein